MDLLLGGVLEEVLLHLILELLRRVLVRHALPLAAQQPVADAQGGGWRAPWRAVRWRRRRTW